MLASLRRELRALLELYLIPGLSALAPWPLGFRWLRFCSRFSWLYHQEWQAALAQARLYVPIDDEALWARQFRLARLVDHADLYLCMTRSDRWLARHVDGWNRWPDVGGAVGVFFHWCPGFWALRALRQQGVTISGLIAPLSRRAMGGTFLAYWYGALRMWQLRRVNGRSLVMPEGAVRRSVKALKADAEGATWVCGMLDVPPHPNDPTEPVTLFERPAHFTTGLFGIARISKVPVVIVEFGLDIRTGRRDLTATGPYDPSAPGLLQEAVDIWQARIRERPWGFFLWAAMPAWFDLPPPKDAPAPATS